MFIEKEEAYQTAPKNINHISIRMTRNGTAKAVDRDSSRRVVEGEIRAKIEDKVRRKMLSDGLDVSVLGRRNRTNQEAMGTATLEAGIFSSAAKTGESDFENNGSGVGPRACSLLLNWRGDPEPKVELGRLIFEAAQAEKAAVQPH